MEEICANGLDENCNGIVDDTADRDGDGYTRCDGDCCESIGDGCAGPDLVNPGAYDFPNFFDDDCDGVIDNAQASCDGTLASDSTSGMEFAQSIGLCQSTVTTPLPSQRRWGVISVTYSLANGSGIPAAGQHSIRGDFGAGIAPLEGAQFGVLSTGAAAAAHQTAPDFVEPDPGTSRSTSSAFPADWFAANGNALPRSPGCPAPSGSVAYDPILVTMKIRVPSNARGFNVSANLFTADYPEWVCSSNTDFFVALLTSGFVPNTGGTPNPADKNLAMVAPHDGGAKYPINASLAYGTTRFSQCLNGPTGCGAGATAGTSINCANTAQLADSGFDVAAPGLCDASALTGGATGWLELGGNVVGGEVITLQFAVWDTSDALLDTTVLLDNFRWTQGTVAPVVY